MVDKKRVFSDDSQKPPRQKTQEEGRTIFQIGNSFCNLEFRQPFPGTIGEKRRMAASNKTIGYSESWTFQFTV